jgi:Iap family predicted aminopeptidase
MRGSTLRMTASIWLSGLLAVHSMAAGELKLSERVAADAVPHDFLVKLCDDFGGRLTGSAANAAALDRLADELRQLGLQPIRVPFAMPGWVRGEDRVDLVEPLNRTLRVAALAYSSPHAPFTAGVVDVGLAREEDFAGRAVRGRVGLVDFRTSVGTRELVQRAAQHGLRGLLYLNRVNGGQLLARTSSFDGAPLPLPVYSITQEEGRWLQRLIARGVEPVVRLHTRSHRQEVQTANLMVRLLGRTAETIVVGAHFDSWDLGQGAIDNGLGIAQLFALARALRDHPLERSVELVWLNGEEQGLWGSRHQAALARETPVVAMVNLDMVGVPIAVNALGDDDLVPVLERWNHSRGAAALERGVENAAWFGSDHVPYQLAGVRAVTFNAPIDPLAVRYYHDFADTADKVPVALVTESAAIIASLVEALAGDPDLPVTAREPAATRALFQRFGFDRRMEAAGWLPPSP